MRRSSRTGQGLWVSIVSESMQETMKREQEELLATLTRANSALSRLFNVEEEEKDE
jgi:hypothetical protein